MAGVSLYRFSSVTELWIVMQNGDVESCFLTSRRDRCGNQLPVPPLPACAKQLIPALNAPCDNGPTRRTVDSSQHQRGMYENFQRTDLCCILHVNIKPPIVDWSLTELRRWNVQCCIHILSYIGEGGGFALQGFEDHRQWNFEKGDNLWLIL